jgi:hypothetical protein
MLLTFELSSIEKQSFDLIRNSGLQSPPPKSLKEQYNVIVLNAQ